MGTNKRGNKIWYYTVDIYNSITSNWMNVAGRVRFSEEAFDLLDKYMESAYAVKGKVTVIEETILELRIKE